MLSELVWLQGFGKDRLAAMSVEELESCLASARREIAEYEERERENERRGVLVLENSSSRICYLAKMFYETELDLRKRRALNEDRLTLLKRAKEGEVRVRLRPEQIPRQARDSAGRTPNRKGRPMLSRSQIFAIGGRSIEGIGRLRQ